MTLPEDCSTCRHHSKREVPRDVKVSFDEFIETSDETDSVFDCKHPGSEREIGKLPIFCDSYETLKKRSLADIDAMITKWNKRNEDK